MMILNFVKMESNCMFHKVYKINFEIIQSQKYINFEKNFNFKNF
jgi:hypothetical protein